MAKMVAVRPGDLAPDAVEWYPIGTLLVNTLNADLYMVIDDNGVKTPKLIGGSAKYEIMKHLEMAHIISDRKPRSGDIDKSTLWYNTEMVYVEPNDATEAFIMVQQFDNTGNMSWRKILPFTKSSGVIIGKNPDGTPLTLAKWIKEINKRGVVPKTEVALAEYGEIVVQGNNIFWKTGPNPTDKVMVGTGEEYIVDHIKKSVHIMDEHPIDWDEHSIWLQPASDGGIVNAMTTKIYKSIPDFVGGLKFEEHDSSLPSSVNKTGAVISDGGKRLIIQNDATTNSGSIKLNFKYASTTDKFYQEFRIKDKEKNLKIVLSADPIVTANFGQDPTSVEISSVGYTKGNSLTNANIDWNDKTFYLMIDKSNRKVGYGLIDGDRNQVPIIDMNMAFEPSYILFASEATTTANTQIEIKIAPYMVKKIPTGYKGVNNILPNEVAFTNIAPLTNASSVFLDRSNTLNNLHAGAGRLVTTPRNYDSSTTALPGELMLDFNDKTLWAKAMDGTVFPIGGKVDKLVEKHLKGSVKVVEQDVADNAKDNDDPSKIYINELPNLLIKKNIEDGNVIYGGLSVIDNSSDGNGNYKLVLSPSRTDMVWHHWGGENGDANKKPVKTFLDEVYNYMEADKAGKAVYRGYLELFTADEMLDPTSSSPISFKKFMDELKLRMKPNTIYLQSYKAPYPGQDKTEKAIGNIFNIDTILPDGTKVDTAEIEVHKDAFNNLHFVAHAHRPAQDKIDAGISDALDRYTIIGAFNNTTSDTKITWSKAITENKDGKVLINDLVAKKAYVPKLSVNDALFKPNGKIITDTEFNIVATKDGIYKEGSTDNKEKPVFTVKTEPVEGNPSNGVYTINIGGKEDPVSGDTKKVNIVSTEKPKWIKDLPGTQREEKEFVFKDDISSSYKYKGELEKEGVLTDLNTLKTKDSVGYYTLTTNQTNASLPSKNNKAVKDGVLKVYGDPDTKLVQEIIGKVEGDSSLISFKRTYNKENSIWSDWEYSISQTELDSKMDKTGGPITGDLNVGGDVITTGKGKFNGVYSNVFYDADGNKLVWIDKDNGKTNLMVGNKSSITGRMETFSKENPVWTSTTIDNSTGEAVEKKVTKTYAFTEDLNTRMAGFTTNDDVEGIVNRLINLQPINQALNNKVNKTGDTLSGDYIFTGSIRTDKLSVTKKFNSPWLDLTATNFENSTARDLAIKENSNNASENKVKDTNSVISSRTEGVAETIVNMNTPAPANSNTDYISNVMIKANKNGGYQLGRVENNDFTNLHWESIVTSGSGTIVDNLETKDANKALSANMGAKIKAIMPSVVKTLPTGEKPLVDIEPGSYIIPFADLPKYGIDLNRLSIRDRDNHKDAILTVSTEGNDIRSLYLLTEETFAFRRWTPLPADGSEREKDNNSSSIWSYTVDASNFDIREQVQDQLRRLTDLVTGFVIVDEYTYTGMEENNTLPYRLVHTHNHPTNDTTKEFVNFKTNINLTSSEMNTPRAVVNIHLRGYSKSSNSPLEAIMTIILERQEDGSMRINEAESDITYITSGYTELDASIVDNRLVFRVKELEGANGLTFDTYIRIHGLGNYQFEPKVIGWNMGDTVPSTFRLVTVLTKDNKGRHARFNNNPGTRTNPGTTGVEDTVSAISSKFKVTLNNNVIYGDTTPTPIKEMDRANLTVNTISKMGILHLDIKFPTSSNTGISNDIVLGTLPEGSPTPNTLIEQIVDFENQGMVWIPAGERTIYGKQLNRSRRYIVDLIGYFG